MLGKIKKLFICAICTFAVALPVLGGCNGGTGDNSTVTPPVEEAAFTVDKFTVDANLKDWSAEDRENNIFIPVADGQSVNVFAKKLSEGVLLALDVKHHRYVDSSPNKFTNSNLRFSFSNEGAERYITLAGESEGVSEYKITSSSDGEIRSTQIECFVDKSLVENFSSEVRFGFRLHMSGYEEDYFWGYSGDWRVDGCDVHKCSYFISEKGITGAQSNDGNVTIDGNADEYWDSVPAINCKYNEKGVMSVRGFLGGDGAYFLFEAGHEECNKHQYWCYNPNFEFRVGTSAKEFKTLKTVRYSDETVLYSSQIGECNMVTAYDSEANLHYSVFELFIPYSELYNINQDGKLVVGLAFRADERSVTPWVPVDFNGSSSWDMNNLALTKNGWERV